MAKAKTNAIQRFIFIRSFLFYAVRNIKILLLRVKSHLNYLLFV